MESYSDYIDSFNLKPCKNGIHCIHLKKCRCNYKHYKTNDENMNILIEKSNLYAIHLSIERNKKRIFAIKYDIDLKMQECHSITDLERKKQELELENKDNILKFREEVVTKKETELLEKDRRLETEKMDLDRMKIYYYGEFKTQERIIDYKITELDHTIKDYYSKIGKQQCDKFKHFDEEVLLEVIDENVCDICLTPINECNGVDSVFNILECGHSFCMKCIHNLTKDKETMSIKCPTCRKKYSVCTIKRNISLDKVVEHLKRLNVNT
jgi:hypothetical protein